MREALGRSVDGRGFGPHEARERVADLVRLEGRLRRLDERLGRCGVAEISPYLTSLLRLAAGPRIVQPAILRRAASF